MPSGYQRAWGATRQARAARIQGALRRVSSTEVIVPSQRNATKTYVVTVDGTGRATDCNGPDRAHRHAYCKHMRAVDMRL